MRYGYRLQSEIVEFADCFGVLIHMEDLPDVLYQLTFWRDLEDPCASEWNISEACLLHTASYDHDGRQVRPDLR